MKIKMIALWCLAVLAGCLVIVTPVIAADYTKSQGELMDWTLIPLKTTAGTLSSIETGVLDSGEGLDASVTATLHVTIAHTDANALTANSAGFVVLIRVGATDEFWRHYITLYATGGTANVGDCDAESAGAQVNVYVTATTNFEVAGDVYFLHDADSMVASCLIVNGGYKDDDYIMHVDNLVNTYDAADNVYDIVDQWPITLPSSVQAAKIIFFNNDADCDLAGRVDYTLNTDIE